MYGYPGKKWTNILCSSSHFKARIMVGNLFCYYAASGLVKGVAQSSKAELYIRHDSDDDDDAGTVEENFLYVDSFSLFEVTENYFKLS